MGKALAAAAIGILTVLTAIGFAMSASVSSGSVAGSATSSMYSSNSGSVIGYLLSKIGSYVVGSKDTVVSFFNWLLGSRLEDAVANLIVLVIIAGIAYWILRFFKWIITIVVLIDVALIVLKYVLMVI